MKAAVYRVQGRDNEQHMIAMAEGLMAHSISVDFFNSIPANDIDFAVVWSWRVALRVKQYFSGPILVMERGYFDRFNWTSLGWDGLNGRARFTKISDRSRFEKNFSHLLHEWKRSSGYALIMGQVSGDGALIGVDIHQWYRDVGIALWKNGWDIRFRQHPVEVERSVKSPVVPFSKPVDGSLEDAIDGASLVVTYNSNSGTDAILRGCPVHAKDMGSMVFDLASHDLSVIRLDREQRLHEMAWFQHNMDEIKSGAAWEIAKESMIA